MTALNETRFSPAEFILVAFPGMESMHVWIGVPLCLIYVIALLGNSTILYIVTSQRSFHQPMYLLLAVLAITDILLSTSTMPKMLCLLWFGVMQISFNGCLVQMFLIPFLSTIESTILVAMSFDRYIAICHPLRHASILRNQRVSFVALVSVIRGSMFFIPFPLLIKRLPFCNSLVISHSYCVHQDVMKLACADITPNVVYGLAAIIFVMGVDSLLIIMSYTMILRTMCRLSWRERMKALNTCVAHIAAVLIFYVPLIGLSVVHRFGHYSSPTIHMVMGDIYLFMPPFLNPIIYGVKTTKIREKIIKLLQKQS